MTSKSEPERRYFATAARGTEGVLRDELRELAIPAVKATRGGVHFGGDFTSAMRACLHSRIAVRVLEKLAQFPAVDAKQLYQGARLVKWERFLGPSTTLAVRANLRDSTLTHSTFVSLKVKDAIVDSLRDRLRVRPNVDRYEPDVLITVHLIKNQAELFVDLSGNPLHRRGYRIAAGSAPLKETLAAAILRFSGWRADKSLIDPMCGSGTFVIEAAMQAQNVAPGLNRKRFGFERWICHDQERKRQIAELRKQAREIQKTDGRTSFILGRDRDAATLAIARANAKRAGVNARWEVGEVRDLKPNCEPGWLVTNPPYGVRLSSDASLPSQMARRFRELSGFRVCALLSDRELPKAMRLRPTIEHELWNGKIECRLFCWDIP
ncbi:MAG: RNA methyltransferase [Deltaproteobacteria bacterium]|nr:RNA methyltransferase [Deltaproteobacteria bacterium]